MYPGESRRFAPEITMMEFSPLSALEMHATPHGPAIIGTAWVSTPASFKPDSSLSVKRSVPREAIMSTGAPSFAMATAWLAPFPPLNTSNVLPRIVSPGAGRRLAHATRSMLILPTTNNFFSTIFPPAPMSGLAVRLEKNIAQEVSGDYGAWVSDKEGMRRGWRRGPE